jgi:protein gp37
MADRTAIEWAQATWNPVVGCSLVSPGCTNCYAMRMAARLEVMGGGGYEGTTQPSAAGPVWTGKVRLDRRALFKPADWKKPRRIFVNSMSDLFHPAVRAEDILDVFTVMAAEGRHEFMVLTKRGDRMRDFVTGRELVWDIYANWSTFSGGPVEVSSWPLHNVLLGVSVEDQRRADERRGDLAHLAALGWRTFVSYEPALGPVDWTGWDFLAGLISGGESGPRARPSHPDWHRAARDFCAAHGIPYFFKQWGEFLTPDQRHGITFGTDAEGKPIDIGTALRRGQAVAIDGFWAYRVGKAKAGRLLDGREHNALPLSREDLKSLRMAA